MTVIWGFNLSEMSWGAFGSKRMFDGRWYMRKERFIVYQLAMLIALAAECTATYSLSKYDSLQTNVQKYSTAFSPPSPSPHASLHNNDIIDSAITTIVFCVLVATVFGADFFFGVLAGEDVSGWYNVTKKALAMVITAGVGVAAIISTVVISTRQAFITGVSDEAAAALIRVYFRPPLGAVPNMGGQHRLDRPSLVAFAFTVASTLLMFIAAAHDEFGPTPKNILKERESKKYLRANEGGQVSPALPSVPESRQVVLPNRY
ncbi:hypothetical protein CPB84DRAFT_1855328 [Gymnopilus junonius]|uniref:Uncharacterized protein n=1 Tax=Gymnopilus junonius TaxID=109634 RepID=A0A9P5N783_GYMJU|nr:hypothetical protein CPB84DRAFT_1855328 [Gymnopilus junonius]